MIVNSIPDQQVFEDSHFDFTFAESAFVDIDAGDSLTYPGLFTTNVVSRRFL